MDFRFRPLNHIKSTFKRLIRGKKEGFGGLWLWLQKGEWKLSVCDDWECWEEPKRAIGDQGRIFKVLSKGDQVRGALRVKFMFKPDWHAKYGMITYDLYIYFFRVCDSGKFPELVWLVVNCRQTIFSLLGHLGFL